MDSTALYYYAEDAFVRKDYSEAVRAYSMLLEGSSPVDKEIIHAKIFQCFVDQGQYREAYDCIGKFSSNPFLFNYHIWPILDCYLRLGKDIKIPDSFFSFCSCKERKELAEKVYIRDVPASLHLFEEYLYSLQWFDAEDYRYVFYNFSLNGQVEWGLRICRKMKRRFPNLALVEADFLMKAGRYRAALSVLRDLRLFPNDDVLFRKAMAYFGLKDHRNAYECILKINDGYDIHPSQFNPAPLREGLPFLLAKMALDLNCNITRLEEYEKFGLKDPEALNLLALHAFSRKDYAKAEQYAKQALEKTNREDAQFNLMSIYEKRGNDAEAGELMKKLGIQKPGSMETLREIRASSPVFAGFERVRFAGGNDLFCAFGKEGLEVERALKAKKSPQGIMKKLFMPARRLIKILRFCEARGIPSLKNWKERKRFEKEEAKKSISQKYGEIGLKVYALIDGKKSTAEIMEETGVSESKLLEMLAFMQNQDFIGLTRPKEKPQMEEDIFLPKVDEQKRMKKALMRYRKAGISKPLLDKVLQMLENLRPDKAVCNNIGCAFYRMQDFRNAIAYFDKAIKLDKEYNLPKYNKLLSHASLEEYAEAIESANAIVKKDALTHYLRGLCYEYLSQYRSAIDDYKKALELNPNLSQAKTHLEIATGKQSQKAGEKALNSGTTDSLPTFSATVPSADFSNVGGMHGLKELFTMEIIMPLKKPRLARKYSKGINKGYLLQGPPGCGKSHIAEAVAGEAGLNFIRANVSEILNMYVGNSEKNLAAIFDEARRNQPALVFFDEIESLGGKREDMSMHWEKTLVNVFLQEMDKIEKNNERIVVFGATNAPWDLDIALRRSGRMGNEIFIAPPDKPARTEIFEMYAKKLPLESITHEELAELTKGCSIANIKSICSKAANAAWKDALEGNERKITKDDFITAIKSEKSDVKEWMEMAKLRGIFRESLKELKERMYG